MAELARGVPTQSGWGSKQSIIVTGPEWRNWQTRRTQNPVGFTPRVGSTPSSGTNLLRCGVPARRPEEIHKLWAEAFNAGDVEALLSLYEPTARIVPKPGEPTVGGSSEVVREVLSGFLAVRGTIEIKTTSVIEAGEMALLRSEWRLKGTGPHGRAVDVTHRSAEVLRRQPDGTWRYIIDNPFGAD